jgi:hypothetical protein
VVAIAGQAKGKGLADAVGDAMAVAVAEDEAVGVGLVVALGVGVAGGGVEGELPPHPPIAIARAVAMRNERVH